MALRLLRWGSSEHWTYESLGKAVSLSASQVHISISRLISCHLLDSELKRPIKRNLVEFLTHGIRYVFPLIPGGVGVGMPTAHSSPLLASRIKHHQDFEYVWPSKAGKQKGVAVTPLHKGVPEAAKQDNEFYDLLAVVDALRMDRPRELEIAVKLINKLVLEQ